MAILMLNRAKSLNAVNPTMIDALLDASMKAASDPRSTSRRSCSAGKHLWPVAISNGFRNRRTCRMRMCLENYDSLTEGVQALVLNFRLMEKPVIAALQGAVAGFSLSLMLVE